MRKNILVFFITLIFSTAFIACRKDYMCSRKATMKIPNYGYINADSRTVQKMFVMIQKNN